VWTIQSGLHTAVVETMTKAAAGFSMGTKNDYNIGKFLPETDPHKLDARARTFLQRMAEIGHPWVTGKLHPQGWAMSFRRGDTDALDAGLRKLADGLRIAQSPGANSLVPRVEALIGAHADPEISAIESLKLMQAAGKASQAEFPNVRRLVNEGIGELRVALTSMRRLPASRGIPYGAVRIKSLVALAAGSAALSVAGRWMGWW
jgi:hypothetical protein